MAKPRKHKSEEHQRQESPGGVVLHQKLCLFIDMDKHLIYGHTEVKVVAPEGGYVALHAENMTIRSIYVDGEPAEFQFFPYCQPIEDEKRWCGVSCSQSAADVACSTYISSLDKEMVPNLLIACQKTTTLHTDQQGHENGGNTLQNPPPQQVVNGSNNLTTNENVRLIHIDYMVESGGTGIHFGGNVLHTNNQIRRARCWFPCMDSTLQRCSYHLEFTVDLNFVAVSNGNLLYQVLSKDDPPRKTYVYEIDVPVNAGWISLAVGPFEILPDSNSDTILHMCLSPNLPKLQNTVGFFHNVFSYYEDYLSMPFPFGSYKQVFLPPEISVTSTSLGASMCIFSSELLFDEKVIDQTINTRVRLAYSLARQWFGVYITPEEPNDEWLLEGLAGFLTDLFIKRFLGNNEARYQRYKANSAVCKVDVSGVTALSASAASSNLYGIQSIGLYGKIRSWKAVAVLQMLEKQMGPDSFRKILHNIVNRAADVTRSLRALSTKEFRHLANKVGNLERPFLKEFFYRWVESCGCPIMRMGISYNKRRNMIELAVMRGCTANMDLVSNGNPAGETREGDTGCPGMMSIRVHEIDGMYDHPSLPMSGETCQLLEIQCHSKLAAKRFQKPKKGSKPDGSDDNADTSSALDMRNGMDSPLLWIRVDPEMEYLAEAHLYQPVQMWINQLEKDKDVIAQSLAISTLEKLPQLSFSVVNAINTFLNDSKAFWRVRVEAAYALAHTTSEDTDWAGLLHLIKFYKNRRFDTDIGLPRPNDFRDVPEYFVLEAIPHAVALVRAADKKSPREAVEFVLQLLKYNDNNGNPYSDVFWLAALVQSVGELEFGQQSISFLPSLLNRIDRLLQFDSLMPCYNRLLTISCIRTLVQITVKMSSSVPSLQDHMSALLKSFTNPKNTPWKVRIEAIRGLLDLEYYFKGFDATLSLFINFIEEEPTLRGEVKLAAHTMRLCQVCIESESGNDLSCPTLVALGRLVASRKAFNNIFLRHYLFCIVQIVSGRAPTLYGVPKSQMPIDIPETYSEEQQIKSTNLKLRISKPQEALLDMQKPNLVDTLPTLEPPKEADTVSNCSERRMNILKIRVRQPSSSSKVDGMDHPRDHSHGCQNETEHGPSSSVSVDAPARLANEPLNTSNQHIEEVNSSHDQESQMIASIGSAKLVYNGEFSKELQCTADSSNLALPGEQLSPSYSRPKEETFVEKTGQIQTVSPLRHDGGGPSLIMDDQEGTVTGKKDKVKKRRKHGNDSEKDSVKVKKRRKNGNDSEKDSVDPEYLERKRRKKEKKRLKALEKLQKEEGKTPPELTSMQKEENTASSEQQNSMKPVEAKERSLGEELKKLEDTVAPKVSIGAETKSHTSQSSSLPKIKLKIKGRSIGNL